MKLAPRTINRFCDIIKCECFSLREPLINRPEKRRQQFRTKGFRDGGGSLWPSPSAWNWAYHFSAEILIALGSWLVLQRCVRRVALPAVRLSSGRLDPLLGLSSALLVSDTAPA